MKKVILVTSVILVLGIIICMVVLNNVIPEIKPIYKQIEIKSNAGKESLFLKQKVWGITSDNSIIVISNSSKNEFEIDSASDYVFKGYSTFFYRQVQDSLYVYVSKKVKIPPKLYTEFEITQIELSNTEMMNLLANNSYKKKGLYLF